MGSMLRRGAVAAVALVLLGGTVLLGQERDPRASQGERLFVTQGCYGCHQIGKFGTPIGPDLSRLGTKHQAAYLRDWLRDPESVKSTAHMPKLDLSRDDIEALATYLASLKGDIR